jgi:hypothetical protein
MYYSGLGILANIFLTFLKKLCKPIISVVNKWQLLKITLKFLLWHQKAGKEYYRVKSWVIFNKGQFTHICQLNVSCGQDFVSGMVHYCVFQKHLYVKLILNFKLLLDTFFHKVKTNWIEFLKYSLSSPFTRKFHILKI